jgi:hypothetical protein
MIVAEFGMNFRTKLVGPRTEQSSLIEVGVFNSTMAQLDIHQQCEYRQRTTHAHDDELASVQNGFWMVLMSSLLLEVLGKSPLII